MAFAAPMLAATYQVTQGSTPTTLQGRAFWKSWQYVDNYFHATNRCDSNRSITTEGGLADDEFERLL
jgi:hypothetical protein